MKEKQNSLLISRFWNKDVKHVFVDRRLKNLHWLKRKNKHISGNLKLGRIEFREVRIEFLSIILHTYLSLLGS